MQCKKISVRCIQCLLVGCWRLLLNKSHKLLCFRFFSGEAILETASPLILILFLKGRISFSFDERFLHKQKQSQLSVFRIAPVSWTRQGRLQAVAHVREQKKIKTPERTKSCVFSHLWERIGGLSPVPSNPAGPPPWQHSKPLILKSCNQYFLAERF